MTKYINVGVQAPHNKSKKALKEAIASNPEAVVFYGTTEFGIGPTYDGHGDTIPEGVSLSVVGPDPYTKRNWYAQVVNTPKGPRVS
jgi:hypothetical protein